jgi:peptidoglycan/xylan/chitin deacetylase (PgdA/CDA1 family)
MNALRLPVLMLHHVEEVGAQDLVPPPIFRGSYIDRGQLRAMLDTLAGRGYRTWTLAAAAAHRRAERRLPRRSLVLTFDDGCRCFRDHVLQELLARGMTATLFVVSGELGGTNCWDRPAGGPLERREDLLDAAALRELAAAGIEIGSHSRHHRDLTTCDAAELADEVAGSRTELEAAIDAPVVTFCYPYGRFDARVRAAAEAAGYAAAVAIAAAPAGASSGASAPAAPSSVAAASAAACATRSAPAHALHPAAPPAALSPPPLSAAGGGDLFAVPRLPIRPGESPFELLLKASGAYPWWSRLPRLGLLRALRRDRRPVPAAPAARQGGGESGR